MAEKEYIEREAVIERLKQSIKWCENELELGEFRRGCIASLRDEIGNLKHSEVIPTADVAEVVHGEWQQNKYYKSIYYCSKCGRRIVDRSQNPYEHFPYCHCGAKMDKKEAPVKKDTAPIDKSRCRKCIYEMTCLRDRDFEGTCPDYKRDAPDGGYYG